jgi:peptidyl-prolyl cis-trans isomerase A (cyclophilin A)
LHPVLPPPQLGGSLMAALSYRSHPQLPLKSPSIRLICSLEKQLMRIVFFLLSLLFLNACNQDNPRILFKTGFGKVVIELYQKQAPITVANFLYYTDAGKYNGAEFYRVVTPENQPGREIKIEVVQGGLQFVENIDTIHGILHEDTRKTGLRHLDGTLSMARDQPGSASTEFFICLGEQPELDFGGKRNPDGQGFAAFGRVIEGMDVIRKIQKMPADSNQMLIQKVKIDRIEKLN